MPEDENIVSWPASARPPVDLPPDPAFDAMTARLLRREALRRAAEELNTTSGPGLESVLARISAEVTAEAACRTETAEAAKPAARRAAKMP